MIRSARILRSLTCPATQHMIRCHTVEPMSRATTRSVVKYSSKALPSLSRVIVRQLCVIFGRRIK